MKVLVILFFAVTMTSRQQVAAQCLADFDLVFVVDSSESIRVSTSICTMYTYAYCRSYEYLLRTELHKMSWFLASCF